METGYNKIKNVKIFAIGNMVYLKIPVADRNTTNNKWIFCRVISMPYTNCYTPRCESGILKDSYLTKDMDSLSNSIPHKIPSVLHNHLSGIQPITLHQAAHLQSPAKFMKVHCRCKGACDRGYCKCKKSGNAYILHCHGRDVNYLCTNLDSDQVIPTCTFSLKPKTCSSGKKQGTNTKGKSIAQEEVESNLSFSSLSSLKSETDSEWNSNRE